MCLTCGCCHTLQYPAIPCKIHLSNLVVEQSRVFCRDAIASRCNSYEIYSADWSHFVYLIRNRVHLSALASYGSQSCEIWQIDWRSHLVAITVQCESGREAYAEYLGATLKWYLPATGGHIISSTHNTNRSRNDLFARNGQATNVERLPDGEMDGRTDKRQK